MNQTEFLLNECADCGTFISWGILFTTATAIVLLVVIAAALIINKMRKKEDDRHE
jgi:hypothetical protein